VRVFNPFEISVLEPLARIARYLGLKLYGIFLSPGGTFSLASLLCALCIILLVLGHKYRKRKRPIGFRLLVRAVFPKKIMLSRSTRTDVWFFAFNTMVAGLLFGWAILSAHVVSSFVNNSLVAGLGAPTPSSSPAWVAMTVMTIAAFIAYEFGYWLDHYLSHKVPFLWEFHKVHHQAEVLTPITNFRVHPVDSIVFVNILAVTMGTTAGVIDYLFGKPVASFSPFNVNALILVETYLLDHLHHTQFWIPFTGWLGRILISPAHHQIHHSTNPIHFDKNMGSCLALFDWMFGTLCIPKTENEHISFGVTPRAEDPHSVQESLINPVVRAAGHLNPFGDRPAVVEATQK
jgi:sterol desaturase/sphingolipid hydroxylase (fatty acid hydroxylase superfamily)